MKIGKRPLLLPLKVCLSRWHDRGVRVPAVRVARDEDERAGVAGDRLVRARPVGARCRGGPAKALGDQAAISKSTVSAIRGQIKDEYQTRVRRRLDGVKLDYLVQDASFFRMYPGSPGRAGAGRLGHHHQRQAGLHRPGPRHWRVIRRMEGLPRRPG
jgi:hypothetical protein